MSPRWHFNKENIMNVLWVCLHFAIAAFITELIQLLGHYDFGVYTPEVMIGLGLVSKTVGQWVSGQPCTQTSIVGAVMPSQTPSVNTPVAQVASQEVAQAAGATQVITTS